MKKLGRPKNNQPSVFVALRIPYDLFSKIKLLPGKTISDKIKQALLHLIKI